MPVVICFICAFIIIPEVFAIDRGSGVITVSGSLDSETLNR